MKAELTRAFVSDLEVRSDGRTIHGIVVPFGKVARVSDGGPSYDEAFERGAFAKTITQRGDRVKLLMHHDSTEAIGRATLLREDAAGLYGEFHVSEVQRGDEALSLVRDGVLDSFSVGFKPIQHVKRDRVTWRTEVGLRESSLVTFPAYEDAMVTGVRSWLEVDDDELLALAERLNRLGSTAREGSEALDLGTSAEAAPTEDAPPARALRSDLKQAQRLLALRRAIKERGIAS